MGLVSFLASVLALFRRAPVKPVPVAAPTSPTSPARIPVVPLAAVTWISLCRPLTEHFESCLLVAYWDSRGKVWTCGWGTTGPEIRKGTIWTQEHADSQLTVRLDEAADDVDRLVKVPVTPTQKAALTDFVYNEGAGHLAESTLLKYLNRDDYLGAANEFLVWDLAGGVEEPGLDKRRQAERSLFLTGAWQS